MKYSQTLFSLLWAVLIGLCAGAAQGQIYVSNYTGAAGSGIFNGGVGKYDLETGAVINATFVTGLEGVTGVAVDNNGHLFVANVRDGVVGLYDSNTGATINASFITGLNIPMGIVLDGLGNLYVGSFDGKIGQYNATTGVAINRELAIAPHPHGIAIDAQRRVFVTTNTLSSVHSFNADTGAAIGDPLIEGGINGMSDPVGIVVDGNNHLFVANEASGAINEYDATTGAIIDLNIYTVGSPWGMAMDGGGNFYVTGPGSLVVAKFNPVTGESTPAFISGLTSAQFIAIAPVPEPSALMLLSLGTIGLLARRAHSDRQKRPSIPDPPRSATATPHGGILCRYVWYEL